jgi:hypothetical protein
MYVQKHLYTILPSLLQPLPVLSSVHAKLLRPTWCPTASWQPHQRWAAGGTADRAAAAATTAGGLTAACSSQACKSRQACGTVCAHVMLQLPPLLHSTCIFIPPHLLLHAEAAKLRNTWAATAEQAIEHCWVRMIASKPSNSHWTRPLLRCMRSCRPSCCISSSNDPWAGQSPICTLMFEALHHPGRCAHDSQLMEQCPHS